MDSKSLEADDRRDVSDSPTAQHNSRRGHDECGMEERVKVLCVVAVSGASDMCKG
jgi:hypothetical protein